MTQPKGSIRRPGKATKTNVRKMRVRKALTPRRAPRIDGDAFTWSLGTERGPGHPGLRLRASRTERTTHFCFVVPGDGAPGDEHGCRSYTCNDQKRSPNGNSHGVKAGRLPVVRPWAPAPGRSSPVLQPADHRPMPLHGRTLFLRPPQLPPGSWGAPGPVTPRTFISLFLSGADTPGPSPGKSQSKSTAATTAGAKPAGTHCTPSTPTSAHPTVCTGWLSCEGSMSPWAGGTGCGSVCPTCCVRR